MSFAGQRVIASVEPTWGVAATSGHFLLPTRSYSVRSEAVGLCAKTSTQSRRERFRLAGNLQCPLVRDMDLCRQQFDFFFGATLLASWTIELPDAPDGPARHRGLMVDRGDLMIDLSTPTLDLDLQLVGQTETTDTLLSLPTAAPTAEWSPIRCLVRLGQDLVLPTRVRVRIDHQLRTRHADAGWPTALLPGAPRIEVELAGLTSRPVPLDAVRSPAPNSSIRLIVESAASGTGPPGAIELLFPVTRLVRQIPTRQPPDDEQWTATFRVLATNRVEPMVEVSLQ